jgi:hypothetical protein
VVFIVLALFVLSLIALVLIILVLIALVFIVLGPKLTAFILLQLFISLVKALSSKFIQSFK